MTKTILQYETKNELLERYEIEFKIKGLVACKPDTFLTNEMKVYEKNLDDHSFSILVSSDGETNDDAIDIASQKLNMYLDFYNLFFDGALEIDDEGKPFSVAKVKGGNVIEESFAIHLDVGPFFLITEDIKETAIDVLTVLSKSQNSYLRVAADYNRRASLEQEGTNEFIHLFIALEALYAHDEERAEIQYKFANRIATLLGKDKDNRKSLRERARKLYGLRSKIVHGSAKFNAENIEDAVDWVKESILRFLILSDKHPDFKHKDIIKMIEDAMLENDLREKLREESEDLVKTMEETKTKAKKEIDNAEKKESEKN